MAGLFLIGFRQALKLSRESKMGEVARLLFPICQPVGRTLTAADERPSEIVQRTAVTVCNDAQPKANLRRKWRDSDDLQDEAMTLRVVVTSHGIQLLSIRIICEDMHVFLQRFGFSYRPAPFESSAVESPSAHAASARYSRGARK